LHFTVQECVASPSGATFSVHLIMNYICWTFRDARYRCSVYNVLSKNSWSK